MKFLISLITITCLASNSLQAQFYREKRPVTLDLYYQYSLPMGDFKDNFIDKGSAAGFGFDIMYWMKPGFSLGGSFGFQDYYQKYPRALYKLSDGSDISAVVSNSLQTMPVMVKANYLPLAEKSSFIQPYLAAGAGVNIITYSQYLGEFGGSNTKAGFTAQAGAGLKIPLKKNSQFGFLLGANYQLTTYNNNDLKNINALNVTAGVRFKLK